MEKVRDSRKSFRKKDFEDGCIEVSGKILFFLSINIFPRKTQFLARLLVLNQELYRTQWKVSDWRKTWRKTIFNNIAVQCIEIMSQGNYFLWHDEYLLLNRLFSESPFNAESEYMLISRKTRTMKKVFRIKRFPKWLPYNVLSYEFFFTFLKHWLYPINRHMLWIVIQYWIRICVDIKKNFQKKKTFSEKTFFDEPQKRFWEKSTYFLYSSIFFIEWYRFWLVIEYWIRIRIDLNEKSRIKNKVEEKKIFIVVGSTMHWSFENKNSVFFSTESFFVDDTYSGSSFNAESDSVSFTRKC